MKICVMLRNTYSILTDATMDEAEDALIDAGVVTDLTAEQEADESPIPPLHDEELAKLTELASDGYKYLARDKDGKLYAFRHKPKYGGFYWDDPDPAPALQVDGLTFISEDDKEPTEISSLLPDRS
ncbi:MAG: hypothetical protein IJI97_10760 [Clostridia bacterium]|nr:hypothetical protein [Clostridia bacterium]